MTVETAYLLALSPVAGTLINVIAQVAIYRITGFQALLKSIVAGFTCGALVMLCMDISVLYHGGRNMLDAASLVLMNLGTFGAIGFCYFTYINLGTTARRIRMLIELDSSPDGLTYEELLLIYNSKGMVDQRLKRLLDSNQIVRREGRLYIGVPFVLMLSRFIVWLKIIFLGKASETDNIR